MTKGCNIPDIDIVVQWKLTSTVSSFVQRAGRAARAAGRTGFAVLLVEKSVYEANLDNPQDENKKGKKSIRQSAAYSKAKTKDYAIKHGVLRGAYGGLTNEVGHIQEVPVDIGSIDEGLYGFVQSTTCRWAVLTRIYRNKKASKYSMINQSLLLTCNDGKKLKIR